MKASQSAQRYKAALDVATRNVKSLHDAGVTIAMGTDTGPVGRFQGYFELMELEMMVKAGLTPKQALLSATRDAAKCQMIDREVGTLEAGKWADFVVLNADPDKYEVLAVRIIDTEWSRETGLKWDDFDKAWVKYDSSSLDVAVAVKWDAKHAAVFRAELIKLHLKGNTIIMRDFFNPKPSPAELVLLSKFK